MHQFLRRTFMKIVLIIQTVDRSRAHHEGVGADPVHRMGKIITVLLQLLFDSLLSDLLAFEFNV